MSIRPGRFLSIAIVSLWLGLLGFHISRNYARSETTTVIDLSASSGPAEAELTQRGVFYRGERIGYIRERLTPLENGYRAEQSGEFTLKLLGQEREMRMEGSATTGSRGELRTFKFQLTTSSRRSPFETTVLGRVDGNQLELTIRSSRSERTETRTLDEPIVLPLNLYYSLASNGWTSGETYRVRLFDPMTLSEGEATIEVRDPEIVRWGGHEEEAFRLKTTFAGLTTTAWVNDRGEVLQEETPLGWTLRKEAPGSSLQAREAGAAPDIFLASAVPAIGFRGEAAELDAVVLKLERFPDGFDALDGGRQRVSEGHLHIKRERAPYSGPDLLSKDELTDALRADAFIQSDDSEIRKQAEAVTGGLTDIDKARALSNWVFENVAKSPTLSVPSAREVLDNRVGDCNEHAVLYAALARAVDLPTRIATGLAYTGGQFYYHAWPEVWVGRWLAVDPTFGQFPADPMHVRLLTGGLETQYEILKILGRGATIKVLETR